MGAAWLPKSVARPGPRLVAAVHRGGIHHVPGGVLGPAVDQSLYFYVIWKYEKCSSFIDANNIFVNLHHSIVHKTQEGVSSFM